MVPAGILGSWCFPGFSPFRDKSGAFLGRAAFPAGILVVYTLPSLDYTKTLDLCRGEEFQDGSWIPNPGKNLKCGQRKNRDESEVGMPHPIPTGMTGKRIPQSHGIPKGFQVHGAVPRSNTHHPSYPLLESSDGSSVIPKNPSAWSFPKEPIPCSSC